MDKPFALFCGYNYYPNGGMNDYHSSYATLEEALAAATDPDLPQPENSYCMEIDWYQIADQRTMQVVAKGDGPAVVVDPTPEQVDSPESANLLF